MKRVKLFSSVLLLGMTLPRTWSAGIGALATSVGDFKVNGVLERGTSSVPSEATIETGRHASELRIAGGALVQLAPESRAELHQGAFYLVAGSARVRGPISVRNQAGVHIAALRPGDERDLSVRPNSTPTTVELTGIVRDGVIHDELSRLDFKLSGDLSKISKQPGGKYSIKGSLTKDGASIEVSQAVLLQPPAVASTQPNATAQTTGPAVQGTATSTGTAASVGGISAQTVLIGGISVAASGTLGTIVGRVTARETISQ